MKFNFEDVNINPVSVEMILAKVSEIDVFSYYISSFKELGKVFKSELRNDNRASCSIKDWNGKLLYRDFSLGESLDCFNYVARKFNCRKWEALNIIATDFNIVKTHLKANGQLIIRNEVIPQIGVKVAHKSKESIIEPIYKPWCLQDFNYWNSYGISFDVLEKFNAKPVKTVFINTLRLDYKNNSPIYCYEFNDKYKIYRPLEKEFKWFSNTKACNIQGWKQLPEKGDLLIITKSLKDVMCYNVLGINAIAPQSEGSDIPEYLINNLKTRFKTILVNYDGDYTGTVYSQKLALKYNLKYFFIEGDKDISDKIKRIGIEETKQYINNRINEYITNS